MYPILFEFFGFPISTFGVMMAVGFLVSAWIVGKRLGAGNVQQNAAAEDRRNTIDRVPLDAAGVRLRLLYFRSAKQSPAAREVAQGVHVGAYVRSHRDGVGRRAMAGRTDVLAVLLYKAE